MFHVGAPGGGLGTDDSVLLPPQRELLLVSTDLKDEFALCLDEATLTAPRGFFLNAFIRASRFGYIFLLQENPSGVIPMA